MFTTVIILLYFIITLLLLRDVLFTPGVLLHHDWNIPPYTIQIIRDFPDPFFYAWQYGQDATQTRGGLKVLGFINRILALIFHINGETLSKGYVFLTLYLSGIGMFLLCYKRLKGSITSSFLAGFFYMLSPWIFDRIVAGDIYRMIGYALLPFIFYFFTHIMVTTKRNTLIAYSILLGLLMSIVSIITTLMLLIPLFIYVIEGVLLYRKQLMKATLAMSIIVFVIVLLNLYWILPTFVFKPPKITISEYPLEDLVTRSRYSHLLNVIRLMGLCISWYMKLVKNTLFYSLWCILSFMIPIMSFMALLRKRKNEYTTFASILALVSLFLGKGVNPPLGEIYMFLYMNIPYFAIFREVNKWVMLTSFSYALLLCESLNLVNNSLKYYLSVRGKRHYVYKRLLSLVNITMVIVLCIYSWPFLTGNFGQTLRPVKFPEYYEYVVKWLSSQKGDFKVLWLPSDPYIQYRWCGYPSYQQRDVIAFYSTKQNFITHVMLYQPFEHFILSLFYYNYTEFIGKILGLLGVKYIIFRHDAEPWSWRFWGWTYMRSKHVMSRQKGLYPISSIGNITIYENEYCMYEKVIGALGIDIISGGFSTLITLSYLDEVLDILKEDPMIFSDELTYEQFEMIKRYISTIIIKDNDLYTLMFTLIPDKYKINPVKYIVSGNPYKGWARLHQFPYWLCPPCYLDNVGDCAITYVKNAKLNIFFRIDDNDYYMIWIRVFLHPKLHFSIYLDNHEIFSIKPYEIKRTGFSWIKVASLKISPGIHKLCIVNNSNSELIIAKIVILPRYIFENAYRKFYRLMKHKHIILLYEAESSALGRNTIHLRDDIASNMSQGLAIPVGKRHSLLYKIHIPKPSDYVMVIRFYSKAYNKLSIDVMGSTHIYQNTYITPKGLNTILLGLFSLDTGEYTISFSANATMYIDFFALVSIDYLLKNRSSMTNLTYKKINSAQYVVTMKENYPILILLEPYNANWCLLMDNYKGHSIPLMYHANCFIMPFTYKLSCEYDRKVTLYFEKNIYYEPLLYIDLLLFNLLLVIAMLLIIFDR